jgi:alpha(1,3/1,4) fucosyltransferase
MTSTRDIALFIDPFSYHFLRDRLFDPSVQKFNGDNPLEQWLYLRDWFTRRGVSVHTADYLLEGKCVRDLNIFVSFGMREHYHRLANMPNVILSAFYAFESPTVEPGLYKGLKGMQKFFKRIFTFSDAQSLKPFLRAPLKSDLFCLPTPLDSVREDLWSRQGRKFLVMVNNNRLPAIEFNELYTERMRAIEFFAHTGDIELYGQGWAGPSHLMGIGWMPGTAQKVIHKTRDYWQRLRPVPALVAARKVYKGTIPSKLEALSRYTFSICFENVKLNGWVTEKIFDCFAAGNIPVYWGPPDIEKRIAPECFIDMRRFANYQELHHHLKSLSAQDIKRYRENGHDFFRSAQFKPFTKLTFTEKLARVIEEDTGVRL